MFRDAFGPHVSPSRGTLASLPDGLCATIEVWGVSLAACVSVSLRFNRVVTASDSVDTSRMERPVLCACVGPQRTLLAPAGGWRCRSRPSGSGVAAVARFFIGFRYPLIYCRRLRWVLLRSAHSRVPFCFCVALAFSLVGV